MQTDQLNYNLPTQHIATIAAEPRDAARLLICDRHTGKTHHAHVRDLASLTPTLPGLPQAGDLLVFNNSRVLPARLTGRRAATGGRIEALYLASPAPDQWRLLIESRGKLKPGEWIDLHPWHDLDTPSTLNARLQLTESLGGGAWNAQLHATSQTLQLLQAIGRPPLPPYIRRARKAAGDPDTTAHDTDRYNTVFAAQAGSVAAPTAGLHFTDHLLQALKDRGLNTAHVTLHVGIGTFAPVKTDRLDQHDMHSEWIQVPPQTIAAIQQTRAAGRRIIPIGTTTVRTLESLPADLTSTTQAGFRTDTQLFIYPGGARNAAGQPVENFTFRFTDALLTNFHLPRSTLLALVAALPNLDLDQLKTWYQTAIEHDYRFYSYGDAMLIV